MNEAETRADYIDPALKAAGWGEVEESRIRREYSITLGRLEGQGRRGKPLTADYLLVYRNKKLAVVEAKAYHEELTEGLGQAKDYAEKLTVRYTYSSNGQGFYGADMETGAEYELQLSDFPSPQDVWDMTYSTDNIWRNRFAKVPFADKGGQYPTRFYQDTAVENALDAIAGNRKRILLTLATGTGKTRIAFQIAWKLFHSKWNLRDWQSGGNPTRTPRILFLADRNILADQAFNEFSDFPEDALVRISPADIRKKGQVPKNGSLFFTIFQTFMTGPMVNGKPSPYFGEYEEDFFDLIFIDECHRGGANDESTWREILEYFSSAVQIGLTATPRRSENRDTYHYFGEPVYTYSLKDGINDGYLTPFRVKQITTSLDEYEYSPDDEILEGDIEEGRVYTETDFNKIIEIKAREKHRVKMLMDQINQNEKTIVFCATQDHALAVRNLINQYNNSGNPNYCQRVTANDGALGEKYLRDFQDNEKTMPTILTTSQKLSTGVDARNVRNIVLMRPINSMIEFKQIIGRGTRLYEGKDYFTIYDFVRAHEHFNDDEWDGPPDAPDACSVCNNYPCTCRTPGPKPCAVCGRRPCICETPLCPACGEHPCICKKKVKVKLADGKERTITDSMATTFWHPNGQPMSAHEFLEALFGKLPQFFKDEEELREIWSDPITREKLLEGLAEQGFGSEQLAEIKAIINAENSDIYDVLAFVAYNTDPLTREERAAMAQAEIRTQFNKKQRAFLDFVLLQYVSDGVKELEQSKLSLLLQIRYRGSFHDATADLGSAETISKVFRGFQKYLYKSTAA